MDDSLILFLGNKSATLNSIYKLKMNKISSISFILVLIFAAYSQCKVSYSTSSTYPQISSNPSDITYPKANLQTLSTTSSTSHTATGNTQAAIQNARSSILTTTRSIDSLFTRVPSSSQLDELVQSADSVAIIKTIQVLVTNDSIPCGQILSYLLELLGRIRTAIQKKKFAVEQLTVIIDSAKKEISRLTAEIERIQSSRQNLWLGEKREKVSQLISDLQVLYKQFNFIQSQIPLNEAQLAGYNKEMESLQKSSDLERKKISNDKLRLTEVSADIRDLKLKLQLAEQRKIYLEASISKSEATISDNNLKVETARMKVREIEDAIKRLQDQSDALQAESNKLEVQVERIRSEIIIAEAKDQDYAQQIAGYKQRIQVQKTKLAEDNLADLKDMVEKLQRMIPSVQSEIDRQYYYCYGDGSVEILQTGSVQVFIIRGEEFEKYITKAYGEKIGSTNVRRSDLNLQRVDVYSSQWSGAYGNFRPSEFSCIEEQQERSGQGQIVGILSDSIQVMGANGITETLQVGACSRVESTTSLPRKGQNIIWKGFPSTAGRYNISQATCW